MLGRGTTLLRRRLALLRRCAAFLRRGPALLRRRLAFLRRGLILLRRTFAHLRRKLILLRVNLALLRRRTGFLRRNLAFTPSFLRGDPRGAPKKRGGTLRLPGVRMDRAMAAPFRAGVGVCDRASHEDVGRSCARSPRSGSGANLNPEHPGGWETCPTSRRGKAFTGGWPRSRNLPVPVIIALDDRGALMPLFRTASIVPSHD